MYTNLQIIINPASGKDEAILSYISRAFKNTSITWDVSITQKDGDAGTFAQEAIQNKKDAVVVYGGDGTVTEVALALFKTSMPLIVLPGGTANVVAKELKMPLDSIAALELIAHHSLYERKIDMGICGETPFLLRINVGFVADMISKSDPQLKATVGQLAYGVAAVQHLLQSELHQYQLTLDGVPFSIEGYAVVIANVGNIGFSDVSYVPEASVTDGKLDVLVLHKNDIGSVVKAAGTALFQQKSEDVFSHWQVHDVGLVIPKEQTVLRDDFESSLTSISASVCPEALTVLVPRNF